MHSYGIVCVCIAFGLSGGKTASSLDEHHIAKSQLIAEALGKTTQQVSRTREALLQDGIIIAVGHGELMFNIPYLRTYLGKETTSDANIALIKQWMP
ncbi:MAG: hypothetical protein IKE43_11005 [Coriobacteriales bacterium]|nr:hypothetical protein [Coriobacteriales bacterium]